MAVSIVVIAVIAPVAADLLLANTVALASSCFTVVRCIVSAVVGILKGFDPLVNLVLDEAVEYLRGVAPPAALLSTHVSCCRAAVVTPHVV